MDNSINRNDFLKEEKKMSSSYNIPCINNIRYIQAFSKPFKILNSSLYLTVLTCCCVIQTTISLSHPHSYYFHHHQQHQKISSRIHKNNRRVYQPSITHSFSSSSSSKSTQLSLYWGSDDDNLEPIQGQDRFKACIPYILPLLDMDSFSIYLSNRFTIFHTFHDGMIQPLVQYVITFPWLTLILFLVFTLGTRSATYLSRHIRFNAQQAALIDVALVLPMSLGQVFTDMDIPYVYREIGSNTVYFTFIFMIGYCIWKNILLGKKPNQIPWISDIAELMTGPF